MRPFLLMFLLIFTMAGFPQEADSGNEDAKMVQKIFEECLVSGDTYHLLEHLCTEIGPRLSGSQGAADAVAWTRQVMSDYGFDRVFLQEVMVPHWERGAAESAVINPSKSGEKTELRMLAIGGSVPTPASGITAEVIEVMSLDDLEGLGEKAIKGKIVFFNRPFDQKVISTGAGYGGAVDQRTRGASAAARYGAAAVVIRSVTSAMDDNPHTGTLIYTEDLPRIPAGALGYQSADKLTERLKADPKTRLTLTINSQWFPDALSHNVVGELKGSERPDEIIAIGGHLDAWDVGEGAHDDGAGCMQAIMVLRTLQKLGIKPRHTLRAVMFMNEENGLRGGKRYADLAVENTEYHVFLLESDAGAFTPRGFGVNASDEVLEKLRSFVQYFDPNTVTHIRKGGGGADIGPLHRATGTPMAGLMVDTQRTFDYHHAETDLFENVNRRELELGTAAMAAFIYLIDKYGLAADGPQSE